MRNGVNIAHVHLIDSNATPIRRHRHTHSCLEVIGLRHRLAQPLEYALDTQPCGIGSIASFPNANVRLNPVREGINPRRRGHRSGHTGHQRWIESHRLWQ